MSLPLLLSTIAFITVDSTEARLFNKRAESTTAKFANVSSTTTKKASTSTSTSTTKKSTTTTIKKSGASGTKKGSTTDTAVANSSSVSTAAAAAAAAAASSSSSTNTQPPLVASNPTTSDILASSTSTTQKDTASANSSSGISGGAIGGIVAAIIIIVAGVVAYLFLRRKKNNKAHRDMSKPDPFTMGFGSNQALQTSQSKSQMQQNTYQENTTPYQHQYGTVQPGLAVTSPASYITNGSQFHDAESHIGVDSKVSDNVPSRPEQQIQSYQYQPQLNQQYQPQSNQQYQPNTIYQQQDQFEPHMAMSDSQHTSNSGIPLAHPTQAGSIGVFYVAATYTPTLSDEVDIQTGDQVEILVEYDDGWCQGINLSRGNAKGVFPKHCIEYPILEVISDSQSDRAKRVSSMYIAQ